MRHSLSISYGILLGSSLLDWNLSRDFYWCGLESCGWALVSELKSHHVGLLWIVTIPGVNDDLYFSDHIGVEIGFKYKTFGPKFIY